MKKILIAAAAVMFLTGCRGESREPGGGANILASTTMAASLARDIMPQARIAVLIPPDSCPGHFDLKPSDAEKIMDADIFIVNVFQKALAEKMRKIKNEPAVGVIRTVDTTIPDNYIRALGETKEILSSVFPEKADEFKKQFRKKTEEIKKLEKKSSDTVRKIQNGKFKVLVSGMQKGLADYFGMEIKGVFGDPKSLSPGQLKKMINSAEKSGIDIIASNSAGTHDAAADIFARRLNKEKIIFSNFPGVKECGPGFEGLWEYNLRQAEKLIK
ncbi:MAG: metal ABC transporter substrate-binding protein [bacterium]